ncbi:hypothetical protein FQN49_003258 [Arthroderma sp. PD_2]|nr:hypothetical protein FQN49_003258 [Arthroderma sp. PD_2]
MRFFITFLSALLVFFAPLSLVAAEETIYSTSTQTSTMTVTVIHSVNPPAPTSMPTVSANSTAPYPSSMMTKTSTWGTGTGGIPAPTGAPQPPINGAAGLSVGLSTAFVAGSVALLLGAAL